MIQGEFEMSMMGKLNYFLGLQIKQLKNDIFINQSKYWKKILKKFNMDNYKEIATSMVLRTYIDQDESGTPIDNTKYRGMIGSLLQLNTSHSDIMFSVYLCARHRTNPKESHLSLVKRIMKYQRNKKCWIMVSKR